MSFREADLPRALTEDLVVGSLDMEPYSMEATESPLALAEHLREVLLAESRGELDDYDSVEIVSALGKLEDLAPIEVSVLLEAMQEQAVKDIEDLELLLDELVEAVAAES